MIHALLLALLLAQTPPVKNPTGVAFAPSIDHDRVTKYLVTIENAAGTLATIDGGIPPVDPDGLVRVAVNVQPIKFGEYYFRVVAVVGEIASDPSAPSDNWQRVPGAPGKPVVK